MWSKRSKRTWLIVLVCVAPACGAAVDPLGGDDAGDNDATVSEGGIHFHHDAGSASDVAMLDEPIDLPDVVLDIDANVPPDSSMMIVDASDGGVATDASNPVDANPPLDANVPPDTGVVCGSTPSLHPADAGDIYCGFSDAGSIYCGVGEQCCLGGPIGGGVFAPEQCAPFGSACPNPPMLGLPIECWQPADCAANGTPGVCCLRATAPAIVPGCGYYKATGGTGVFCEQGATCAAGEVQACESTSDCPAGKTCFATKWKIYQLGFCQ
jgi:hypothetical protein